MTEKKLFFGLKRSKPEPVDRLLCMSHDKVDLPDKFSLRDKVKQVYDQMSLSSCSANAAANFLLLSDKVDCNISRLFMYFTTRYLDNNYIMPVEDHGATLKNVFVALTRYHYVDEVKYPYIVEKVNDCPSQEIFQQSITINKSPITSYRQILPTKNNIKYILAHLKKPILFGIMIYSNFFKLTKENEILFPPSASDEALGGHALVAVGYDNATDTIEILNSHGSNFCQDGYFKLSFNYALDKDLAFEYYVVE